MAVAAQDLPSGTGRVHRGLAQQRARMFYWMASPWIIGFLVLTVAPVAASLYLSFTRYDVVRPPTFIGIGNYSEMLSDPLIAKSLANTLYYTLISVPAMIVFTLALAILLNQKVHGNALFRTAFYLPSIVPAVANCVLWIWLLQPQWGLINYLLGFLGIRGPAWLASITWSKPALVMMSVWGAGSSMVIFLAGLQSIPGSLYEAAAMDGAGALRKFRHVTLPLLTPTIFFQVVMGIIGSFQVFTAAYIMTGGGPVNSTLFYVLYLYRQAFVYLYMGYASAMAWVLFTIVLLLALVQLWLAPRWVHYEV
ncbi:MAG: carbohydrate ABC transporter permease [Anaerolineae bacterium]